MKKTIDCFFIGHNEMEFAGYEKNLRAMGMETAAYRDLNLNFLRYNQQPYTIADLYNLFHYRVDDCESTGPLGYTNVFNLAIAYLATYIHCRGFTFDYVNSFQHHRQELAEKLSQNNILLIAIPTTLYLVALPIMEIVSFIKQYNDSARIIIGGPFVSYQSKLNDPAILQYLFKSINADFYVNSNRGEETLVKVLSALKNKMGYNWIDNLSYREGARYVFNKLAPEDVNLADNLVNWNLFADRIGKFGATRTSISCPFSCTFCTFTGYAGKYHFVDEATVERDLNTLESLGRIESLNFIDDTFNVPVNRFKNILKMMVKNKYRFKWNSFLRCQYLDRELVELMKESGCEGVILGIESGNELILENMKKAVDIQQYRRGIALLKEYEIITYASFIIGFPGETKETLQDTFRFIEETEPAFFSAALWYCHPLAPIYQEREKFQLKNSQFEWSHATMDVNTACDLTEEMFLRVKNSIWVPYHNFNIEAIYYLLHRGKKLNQIKNFITAFNEGIKEKLRNPMLKEMSNPVAQKLKTAFQEEGATAAVCQTDGGPAKIVGKYKAEFDF